MAERKVRYEAEIDTSNVAAQAQRANAILQQEQNRAAQQQVRNEQQLTRLAAERSRAESAAATARARAGQEYLRSERELQRAIAAETQSRQAQMRLTAEAARIDRQATAERQRQLNDALRVQTQMQRLATETARAEMQAAQVKTRAEQDALRLKLQQAQVAAAEARAVRAQTAPTGSGGLGIAGMGGMLRGGLAAVGIGLGVRELAQFTTGMASLAVQLSRSRQAFTALSGSGQEAERRLAAIQRASANTMTSLEAMNLANRMTALGMANSAQEMETAVSAARKIAVVMGTDTVGAIENLALAASNLSFLRLDQMGISATAVRERMKELRSENAELGKEQAFLQAALQVSAETLKDVDVSGREAASGVEALTSAWGRLKETIATGAIGQGANAFLGGLAQIIDRDFGSGAGQNNAWRKEFEDALSEQRATQVRRNSGQFALGIVGDLDQGKQIEETFRILDEAVRAGLPGLAEYENALTEIAQAWTLGNGISGTTEARLEGVRAAITRLSDENGTYRRVLEIVNGLTQEQQNRASTLVEQFKWLESAYADGSLSAEEYERHLRALSVTFTNLVGPMTAVAAQAGVTSEAMRKAINDADLWVRTGGGAGAGMAPLTQNQKETFDRIRGVRPQGSFVPEEESAWSDPSALWSGMLDTQKQLQQDQKRAQESAAKEWERAAESTQREMEAAAKKLQADFESALGKVPGLLGTSSVTGEDMRMAESGVYQEKADEWLRQLADEVLNGVDRPGVDIEDAKRRAGIDGGMDNKAALAIVQSMWADSSLFAGGANTDLINRAAVERDLARQNASKSGRNAILGMFGIPAEDETPLAASIAAAQSGGAIPDGDAAKQDLMSMVAVMQSQANTEEVTKGMQGIGDSLVRSIHAGFVSTANTLDWAGPIVDAVAASATTIVLGNLNQALTE